MTGMTGMTGNRRLTGLALGIVTIATLAAACGGGAAATPSPVASASAAPATTTPTDAAPSPSAGTTASATAVPTGPATLDAPAEVTGGTQFQVAWTGPSANGDYVTIVAAGATKWTTEPYFYTTAGSPGKLVAPTAAGSYQLWYVSGTDDSITARRPITVTAFQGALAGPDTVEAGTSFQVSWNGPNGPGDYVTIVAAGATKWTNESYFYTTVGSTGTLVSSIAPGAYELWYVTGTDSKTMASRPITVTPFQITLQAPAEVAKGSTFSVTWTGPDGPSDYITIVPAGSAVGAYTDYAYTAQGSPASLTAPAQPGSYEIWYASDRVSGTFKSIPITVR